MAQGVPRHASSESTSPPERARPAPFHFTSAGAGFASTNVYEPIFVAVKLLLLLPFFMVPVIVLPFTLAVYCALPAVNVIWSARRLPLISLLPSEPVTFW